MSMPRVHKLQMSQAELGNGKGAIGHFTSEATKRMTQKGSIYLQSPHDTVLRAVRG